MVTEINTTVFIPTEGPMKVREIIEHVNTPTHTTPSWLAGEIGHYALDHPTATATWEPGKFYDEAVHG